MQTGTAAHDTKDFLLASPHAQPLLRTPITHLGSNLWLSATVGRSREQEGVMDIHGSPVLIDQMPEDGFRLRRTETRATTCVYADSEACRSACFHRSEVAGGSKPTPAYPRWAPAKVMYRTDPAEFAGHVPALLVASANFIGGCCGTTPPHLQSVTQMIHR